MKAKKAYIGLLGFIAVYIAISAIQVSAQSVPNTITGRVFDAGGTGVPNGVPVIIINTNISQMFYTSVSAPPVPSLAGSYSTSINGTPGDYIIVRSYNATHYGETNATIGTSTTNVNVTINIARPSEANITIISPLDNTQYFSYDLFNVTVNMSVLGADGSDCNVTLSITDEAVVSFAPGTNTTNYLGNINMGNYVTTNFELIANATGAVNISATALCTPDGVKLHGLNTYVVYNISVEEIAAPVVSVIFPENNTENKSSNDIVFLFNVTDSSSVSNCSLYINDEYNDTLTPIPLNTTLNFTKYLENGVYNWSINCTDVTLLEGTSGIYYLNVSVYYPNILFFEQIPSIILVPGSVKEVQCNFTVEDGNGASDIDSVNATFYSTTVMSTDPDDNSTHYTNTSCENTGISGNQSNFTCSFNVYYYALNGTWECNATAIDAQNLIETNNTNTTIEPLYALNVSQLFISYGSLSSSEYSGDRQLDITNFGNMNLNISTRAYGGNDPLVGNNTAMLCDSGYNISLDNERYSLSSGIGFESKTPVNYFNEDMGFTIQKQISPSALSINSTYWELLVPPLPVTFCNGTIVLTASEP